MRVYFDNAATTPLDKEVVEAMLPFMTEFYGNPSSIHHHGREVKAAIEKARKTVADILKASPSEIFFTSGGTEADNTAIRCCVETHHIKHILTSPIEHHAVLHCIESIAQKNGIEVTYVPLDEKGNISLDALKQILEKKPNTLVSLMHANNEIGNLLNLEEAGNICHHYKAFFHSDTVQTVGHYRHNLSTLDVDFIVGSAHKFHGPKGIGFLYVRQGTTLYPLIHGGAQERNMRGGTENVYGIIGLAKALEVAYRDIDEHVNHIQNLKKTMINKLQSIDGVGFNGESANLEKSLYTVLNVSLPESDTNDLLLFNLDIKKISASAGSACSSGSSTKSHVLQAIDKNTQKGAVRFSFSKYNSMEEVEYVTQVLASLYTKATV